ncbi:MAG: hypothetical protein METHAR1v1_860008 [Methanothrix sp.]|nr:MAG: hypothetical protein METHAR1v1_860008 [Methanothrix sp.]
MTSRSQQGRRLRRRPRSLGSREGYRENKLAYYLDSVRFLPIILIHLGTTLSIPNLVVILCSCYYFMKRCDDVSERGSDLCSGSLSSSR